MLGSVTMMYIMVKRQKGRSKVGASLYKLKQADLTVVDEITHGRYTRDIIKNALIKSNGDLHETLRYLAGNC